MTETATTTISDQRCRQVVLESVSHLLSIIKADGGFVYAHRLDKPNKALPGYNLLRHCGTAWFMLKAANRLGIELSTDDEQRLISAVSFIVDLLRPPFWAPPLPPTLCLPEGEKVKMGGAGLCLLMLNDFAEFCDRRQIVFVRKQDGLPLKIVAARLKNYMLSELAQGDFYHIRSFSTGHLMPFRSDYYTGQALFSLIQTNEAREICAKLLSQLIDQTYGIEVHAHWMAYAAAEAIHRSLPGAEKTLAYLDKLIGRMIAEPEYRDRRQSTPIACHSEAFMAFLGARKAHDASVDGVDDNLPERAKREAFDNLELQLSWYHNGQFWEGEGSDTVQIDFVQHNAASFLGVLLLESPVV